MASGPVGKFTIRALAAAFMLLICSPASGFGLKTHLWIGQRIIEDLRRDCAFTLARVKTEVPKDVCESIRAHPNEFLAGVLGPDAFPDLVTGQVTTHPGIEGDWQTAQFLDHLYGSAAPGRELAFAAGYVVHAATDTFAHSYVNGYAGDIFALGDERAVELRHFVLEKYIDRHLPSAGPNPNAMEVPASFLRDKLIYNEDAARVALKSRIALHIPYMWAVRSSVGGLERELENLEEEAGRRVADLIAIQIDLSGRVASGELALDTASTALRAQQARLEIEQRAFQEAERGLNNAIGAVRRNRDLIDLYGQQARAARRAVDEAERLSTSANATIYDLEHQVIDLASRIAALPERVEDEICENLGGGCWEVCVPLLGCKTVCNPIRLVCRAIQVLNPIREGLKREQEQIQRRIARLRRDITQAGIDRTAALAREQAAIQQRLAAEALEAQLALAEASAKAAFDVVDARYKAEFALTQEARENVDKLKAELAELREQLLNTNRMKEAIARLFDQSDILSGYAKLWREELDTAGREFILTSLIVARGLANDSGNIFSAYGDWLKCHGSAYTPVPFAGPAACTVEEHYTRLNERFDQLVEEALPEPFAGLYRRFMDLKARLRSQVRDEASKAAVELAKLAAPDPASREYIAVLADPSLANAAKLDELFGSVGDAGGKKLLTFPQAARMFDRDLGMKNGRLDPQAFAPLKNAETLSRLALLDRSELRRLAWRSGADPDALQLQGGDRRYSMLVQSLRSIDGNQQWQPFGLPYARSEGPADPADPKRRQFGYGPADGGAAGMPFFVRSDMRKKVFSLLFPESNSGQLARRPELAADTYPFPECPANLYPVTFNDDGSPRESDPRCAEPGSQRVQPPYSYKRSWRHFLEDLGLVNRRKWRRQDGDRTD